MGGDGEDELGGVPAEEELAEAICDGGPDNQKLLIAHFDALVAAGCVYGYLYLSACLNSRSRVRTV